MLGGGQIPSIKQATADKLRMSNGDALVRCYRIFADLYTNLGRFNIPEKVIRIKFLKAGVMDACLI